MSKEPAPAFQFYAAEYLADENVQIMTMEDEGCYCRLLAICWREGSIPADDDSLTKLCKGTTPSRVVKLCFDHPSKDPSRLMHPRLEIERRKQADWRRKCAKGGRKSAHKRKHKRDTAEQGSSTTAPRVVQLKGNSSSSSSIVSSNKTPLPPLGEIIDKWNSLDQVAKIRSLSDSRKQKLRTRLRDKSWNWSAAMDKFPLRCFNGTGTGWVPHFDWFLRPDTVNGILEGKYDWNPNDSKLTADELYWKQKELELANEQNG